VDAGALSGVILGALGLLVSIAAVIVARRTAKDQTGLDRRLVTIEEARRAEEVAARSLADVRVLVRSGASYTRHLVVQNVGLAPAREVDIDCEVLDSVEGGRDDLPIGVLLPGDEVALLIALTRDTVGSHAYVLTWTDELGTRRHEGTLSVS
jgi:hypothetical protein